jgi:hypothetical protein
MGITKTEFLEDRVRVHYNLQKPYLIPDVTDAHVDVMYDDIPHLNPVPNEVGIGKTPGACGEEICIPDSYEVYKTIVFVFDKYMEKNYGPLEEEIHGPYLEAKTLRYIDHRFEEGVILDAMRTASKELGLILQNEKIRWKDGVELYRLMEWGKDDVEMPVVEYPDDNETISGYRLWRGRVVILESIHLKRWNPQNDHDPSNFENDYTKLCRPDIFGLKVFDVLKELGKKPTQSEILAENFE